MTTFLRLSKYFFAFKWRILAGLLSVTIMSTADTVSALLVARLFGILQQIESFIRQGTEILIAIPIEVYGIKIKEMTIRGYGESFNVIVMFAVAITVIIFIKVIFVYVREYTMSSVQQKILMRFRLDLFDTVVMLPVKYFDKQKTGRIMSRITNDVNALEQSLFQIVEMAQNSIYTIIFATALFYTNWQLTIFTIVVFSISGIISRNFGDRIRSISRDITNTLADISAFLQEKIVSIRIVKSFTREAYEQKGFKKRVSENYSHSMKIVKTVAWLSPINEFFNTLVIALIVIFTAFLFIKGSMTIEAMIQFIILMTFLAKPVKAIGENAARLQRSLVSAALIFEMIDLEKEKQSDQTSGLSIREGNVEFRNVSFSYDGEIAALSNVSFNVKKGEKVALVGPSGSGKTTLINLIPRFYKVSDGEIFIDDVPSTKFDLSTLRSHIAIVPQEVTLFAGTIHENIRYGRLEATLDEVIAAAKVANAHEFVERLENKYETEVGERGLQLSGGQRQRIAIARAILRDPKILLLDEATSALDSESELAVQEALDRLMMGRTSFIIAHRLSTVYRSDRIFVLEGGRIVESGTHDELLQKDSGLYKRLYSLQFDDERSSSNQEK